MVKLFPRSVNFPQLDFGQSVILLGSCFSEYMQLFIRKCGFQSHPTPFGPVFHPNALSHQMIAVMNGKWEGRTVQNNDVFLDYFSNSIHYAFSEIDLNQQLSSTSSNYQKLLANANVLFITFGTANGFRLKQIEKIVANCHKQPQSEFERVCSTIPEIVEEWSPIIQGLQLKYPKLKVVFSVSPVRYTKEGVTENVRSKARLVEAANQLAESFDDVFYFPSFELVNDELRDFSFFKEDRAHPNAQAIVQVEELLGQWLFSEDTAQVVKEILDVRQREQHRILFKGSEAERQFVLQTSQKKEQLSSLFPSIVW